MRCLIFLLVFISTSVFAADLDLADDSLKYSAELLHSIYTLVKIVVFAVGLIILIKCVMDMRLVGAEGSKITLGYVAVGIITATVMMNVDAALSTFGNTYFNKAGYEKVCYLVEEAAISDTCFSDELRGFTGSLKTHIENMSGANTAENFINQIKIVISILQIIGLIYFSIGTYSLKQVADGSSKDGGYGKALTTMIASALIVDLPHTAASAIETLHRVGIQF